MNHVRARYATDFFNSLLVLLRHKMVFSDKALLQQGHRGRARLRATVSRRRTVLIEFATCRSGLVGGTAGSITFGNERFLAALGFGRS